MITNWRLTENGHNATFKYEPAKQNSERKSNSQRNILWFKPPYNLQVKTNIGKKIHLPDQETLPQRPQASQNSKHEHNQA